MITHARPDFEFIEVFTNATMLDKEWASFYKENEIHIASSVYSYEAAEHDRVTGEKGSEVYNVEVNMPNHGTAPMTLIPVAGMIN